MGGPLVLGRQGLTRTIPGARPAGALRASKIAPGDFVERRFKSQMSPNQYIERAIHSDGPFYILVGRQGFEPWLAESESAVLPLDDLPSSPSTASRSRLFGANLPVVTILNQGAT